MTKQKTLLLEKEAEKDCERICGELAGTSLNFYKRHQLVWAFDTEFQSLTESMLRDDSDGEVYLYQFAFITKEGNLIRKIYDNKVNGYRRLTWSEFEEKVILPIVDEYFPEIKNDIQKWSLHITAHYSVAEQSTISDLYEVAQKEEKLTAIQFGKLVHFDIKDQTIFKKVSFADTLEYERSSLDKIGEGVGVKKVDLQAELEKIDPNLDFLGISNFRKLLEDSRFRDVAMTYASMDPVICLAITLGMSKFVFENSGKLKIFATTPQATEFLYLEKFMPKKEKVHSVAAERTFDKEINFKDSLNTFWNRLGRTRVKVPTGDAMHPYKKCWKLLDDFRRAGEATYRGGRNQVYTVGEIYLPAYDFDIPAAYPIWLRLVKGLKLKTHTYFKNGLEFESVDTLQTKLYDLNAFCEYLNTLSDIDAITLQGTFKGSIVFKDGVSITPIVDQVSFGLCEVLSSSREYHVLELVNILKNDFDLIDWSQTKIQEIKIFETEDVYIFRDYIDFLLLERAKYPKGTLYNLLFKLFANAFYGKLSQGVNKVYTNNFLLEEKTKKPESRIFNPVFSSFVTAGVRLLTFEAGYAVMKYKSEHPEKQIYLLNIITDGLLVASDDPNFLFKTEIKQMFFVRTIYASQPQNFQILALKHVNLGGTYIPRPRIDFPLAYIEPKNDIPMKIALPSAYSFHGDDPETVKKTIDELNYLRNHPNEPVKPTRLASSKKIKEKHTLLFQLEVKEIINWNIVGNKMIDEVIDNEFVKGCTLKPFVNTEQCEKNNEYLRKRRNQYLPENTEAMILIQQYQYSILKSLKVSHNFWNKEDNFKNKIYNDLIYACKNLNIKIKYSETSQQLKTSFTQQQFKTLKNNCRSFKFLFVTEKIMSYFEKYIADFKFSREIARRILNAIKNHIF